MKNWAKSLTRPFSCPLPLHTMTSLSSSANPRSRIPWKSWASLLKSWLRDPGSEFSSVPSSSSSCRRGASCTCSTRHPRRPWQSGLPCRTKSRTPPGSRCPWVAGSSPPLACSSVSPLERRPRSWGLGFGTAGPGLGSSGWLAGMTLQFYPSFRKGREKATIGWTSKMSPS